MHLCADLPPLIAQCQALFHARLEPRRSLSLHSWQADWEDNVAMLQTLVDEGLHELSVESLDADALQDTCLQWQNAAQTASTLLHLALERGAPAHTLRPMFLGVMAVWQAYAALLQQAAQAGCAPSSQTIRLETDEYQFALQLLAMAVLLDEPAEITTLTEQLLPAHTDRLLDALSASPDERLGPASGFYHPQPFAGLSDFLDQYGEHSTEPLLPYLEQHYQRFFALSPQAQKAQSRLLGPQAWGWWALEVGALVLRYDLDDSALRDVPHYPADLVDYALGVRD